MTSFDAVRSEALLVVDSWDGLLSVMLQDAARHTGGCELVCGPVSTGGFDDTERNADALVAVTRHFAHQGMPMFDLAPYIPAIERLKARWEREDPLRRSGQLCMPLYEKVFGPFLRSGVITRCRFIATYAESPGAVWQQSECQRLNIPAPMVPHEVERHALSLYA